MMRSRTILASILWLLIAIAMAASAQAGQKKSRRRQVADDRSRRYQTSSGRGWEQIRVPRLRTGAGVPIAIG